MNRRERKKVERQLGINKAKAKMPMSKRLQKLGENVRSSKNKNKEIEDKRRVDKQKQEDDLLTQEINSLATSIVMSEGIPYIQALEKAKAQLI